MSYGGTRIPPHNRKGACRKLSTYGCARRISTRRRVVYYRNGEQLLAVAVRTEAGFSAARPSVLFEGAYFGGPHHRTYDLSPDGKKFVMITKAEQPPSTQLHVVQNWFEELKRLVPVD